MDTQALPSHANSSDTNGLHQIFWELGHLKVEKESGGLRADRLPLGSTLSSSPGSVLEVPAKSLPLSQKHSTHTPTPQELSSALQTLRVFFKVNTFPFLREILVPTLIK